MNPPDYDFAIVGARCAGAATARLLAAAGARVLLIDRSALGSDTLSTSYLMRGAVQQLQRWGLLPQLIAAGTPSIRTTYLHYPSRSQRIDLRPSRGVDALFAPRRTVLDPILVRAAEAAGVEVRFGVRAVGLVRRADHRVCGLRLEVERGKRETAYADTVIGADGVSSSVARWVDAAQYRTGSHSVASVYGYFEGLPLAAYHWYYGHGVGAAAAPTNDGLCTISAGGPAALVPDLHSDRPGCLVRLVGLFSPELAQQLTAARRHGGLRVFEGRTGYCRTPYGPGWALVGDAGYFRDPNTAHGISDALRDAELLANALIESTDAALARYQATRDAASERLLQASDALAAGVWNEAQLDQLLREASQGMRDGLRAIDGLAQLENKSALHMRSYGTPAWRFETRTDSTSGL